ncbi:MAG TPA: DUF167 family protein [Gammaproteobacteria bacterium]
MTDPWRWENGDLVLTLHVQPRASRDELVGAHGDALKVRITAPPVEGKANDRLLRFLADAFGVGRSDVQLVAGATGRRKTFRIRTPRRLPAGIRR